jgi:hypothetical protein
MAKCRALMIYRLLEQARRIGSQTEMWLKRWDLTTPSTNPPNIDRRLRNLEYLNTVKIDSAYITPRQTTEPNSTYKRRLYKTMVQLVQEVPGRKKMRVEQIWPDALWNRIWKNV